MLSGIAAQWRTIARKLRLKNGNMEVIQDNNSRNARMCLQLAIADWLNLEYNVTTNGLPSWKKLAEVVRGVNNALYLRIVEKHPKK